MSRAGTPRFLPRVDFLTPAYDPFAVSSDPNTGGFRVQNMTPPDKVTLDRLLRRETS